MQTSERVSPLSGLIKGLHHITLVTSNQEINRRFYTEVLGLRRVKLTVNQDDIYHRHLFYADDKGTTGSAITFFEWPNLPQGKVGLGSPHHLSYTAPKLEAIPKWKLWLLSHGVSVVGPFARDGRVSLYLRDPDGMIIEITGTNDDFVSQEYLQSMEGGLSQPSEISTDMRLTRFNHASPITSDPDLTAKYLGVLTGIKKSFVKTNPDDHETSILGMGNDEQNDFLRYIHSPKASYGSVGIGSVHHIAVAVEGEEEQLKILRRLDDAKIHNSGIVDRFWFRSLYFRDPDGNLLEIATKGPGYTVDEPPEMLGARLVLPGWLEPSRSRIERALDEIDRNNSRSWPPSYPPMITPPEKIAG